MSEGIQVNSLRKPGFTLERKIIVGIVAVGSLASIGYGIVTTALDTVELQSALNLKTKYADVNRNGVIDNHEKWQFYQAVVNSNGYAGKQVNDGVFELSGERLPTETLADWIRNYHP
ncbi:MAG: hypothetical protein WC254_06965 [Candidatus Woesearchaeota archaeon]|jgi:hypothetical protein